MLSLLTISLIVLGCSSEPNVSPQATARLPAGETATNQDVQATPDKIKFKQADEAEKYALKLRDDGAKLVDGTDRELARLTLDSNKIKIKDPADQVLGYVVSHDSYWKLENADQTQELYVLRRQADGDLKLEDGNDAPIYRIKVRDYGYEIETPAKQSLYKVKVSNGKISLRDASEETVLSTRSPLLPAAMTPFGFDVLTPPQQAALAYAVNRTGGF